MKKGEQVNQWLIHSKGQDGIGGYIGG